MSLVAIVENFLPNKNAVKPIPNSINFSYIVDSCVNPMDTHTLVKKAVAKEQRAFNLLFDLHWDFVYGYLMKKTSNPSLSEEMAVTCFSKAFDKIDQFDFQSKFSSWLIAIAHHQWIDHQRHSQTQKAAMIETRDAVPEFGSPHLGPEEEMIANQKLEYLLELIQSLSPDYRQFIQWRYLEGMSYSQIAAHCNLPLNTVKVKLFRAKKLLAEKLPS